MKKSSEGNILPCCCSFHPPAQYVKICFAKGGAESGLRELTEPVWNGGPIALKKRQKT